MRVLASVAVAVAVALAVQPVAAQKAGDAPLQPSGPWGIDYGEALCTLSRSFGTGEAQVSLGFIPLTGGTSMKIVMIGVPNGDKSGTSPATLGPGADPAMKRFSYTTTDPKTGKPITLIRAMRSDLPRITGDGTLTVTTGRGQVRFALPDIEAALTALTACETDLFKTWGYDPATIATPPRPIGLGTWMREADYPLSALAQSRAGETNFRLTVGVDGKPTGCLVTLASGSPALDASACAAMLQRARFEPATAADGRPVPGLFAHSVMWMIGLSNNN